MGVGLEVICLKPFIYDMSDVIYICSFQYCSVLLDIIIIKPKYNEKANV